MSAIVVERELELDGAGNGFVRLYAPALDPSGIRWICEFHLRWPGFEQRQKASGEDSYQAMMEAFRGAPLFISRTADYRNGRLRCMGAVLSAPPTRQPGNLTNLQAMFETKWIP